MKRKMTELTQKLTKRTNRFLFSLLAVVLAMLIGFLGHFRMFGLLVRAEEAPTQYVSEVRIYQGKTAEAAGGAASSSCW